MGVSGVPAEMIIWFTAGVGTGLFSALLVIGAIVTFERRALARRLRIARVARTMRDDPTPLPVRRESAVPAPPIEKEPAEGAPATPDDAGEAVRPQPAAVSFAGKGAELTGPAQGTATALPVASHTVTVQPVVHMGEPPAGIEEVPAAPPLPAVPPPPVPSRRDTVSPPEKLVARPPQPPPPEADGADTGVTFAGGKRPVLDPAIAAAAARRRAAKAAREAEALKAAKDAELAIALKEAAAASAREAAQRRAEEREALLRRAEEEEAVRQRMAERRAVRRARSAAPSPPRPNSAPRPDPAASPPQPPSEQAAKPPAPARPSGERARRPALEAPPTPPVPTLVDKTVQALFEEAFAQSTSAQNRRRSKEE